MKTGKNSKIIVIADADVALNPVYQGKALPLGLLNEQDESFLLCQQNTSD